MIGTPEQGYRPGLDGIRALAVAAVLLFHLDRLPGGNLGVDAFFVVSGWLITWKLLSEADRHHSIRVRRFWTSRLRRLMPASMAVVLVVAVVWPLARIDVPSLRRDLAWAAVGLSNWGTISGGGDYWARFGDPSPLTHYWSLAIEQQYYLIWPLVLLAILAATRRTVHARRTVAIASIVAAVASVVLMNIMFDPLDPTATYMNTFARAHTLLIGAAAGALTTVGADGGLRHGAVARHLTPISATGAVVIIAVSSESSAWLFSWGFPIFAVAMTVVVVGVADGAGESVLASAPARWLADRSYGLYLWHWPVFLFMSPSRLDVDDTSWLAMMVLDAARVGVSLAIADASFRYLETPIRRRRLWPSWHAGAAAGVSLGALAVLLATIVPSPSSTSAESVVTLPPPPAPADVDEPPEPAPATPAPTHSTPTQTTSPPGTPSAATSTLPDPTIAPLPPSADDTPGPTTSVASTTDVVSPQPVAGPLRVLVTGDSMAVHLSDAMLAQAADHPDELVAGSAAFGGCGLSAGTDGRLHEFTNAEGERELLDLSGCVDQWADLPDRVLAEAIHVVLVDIGPWDAVDIHLADGQVVSVANGVGEEMIDNSYGAFVADIREAGADVVWVTPANTHFGWGTIDDPINDPNRWDAIRRIVDGLAVVQIDLPAWLAEHDLDGPEGRPDGIHLGPGLNERFVSEAVMPVLRDFVAE